MFRGGGERWSWSWARAGRDMVGGADAGTVFEGWGVTDVKFTNDRRGLGVRCLACRRQGFVHLLSLALLTGVLEVRFLVSMYCVIWEPGGPVWFFTLSSRRLVVWVLGI